MPVTLKELAVRARVHPSTISRVANNDPSLRIAPTTRQRIETLLRETEYRPNGVARGLKLRQTFALAVVPVWFAVHLFAAVIAETRLLLVPYVVVFVPGALMGFKAAQEAVSGHPAAVSA